jgi:hypothetical protein
LPMVSYKNRASEIPWLRVIYLFTVVPLRAPCLSSASLPLSWLGRLRLNGSTARQCLSVVSCRLSTRFSLSRKHGRLGAPLARCIPGGTYRGHMHRHLAVYGQLPGCYPGRLARVFLQWHMCGHSERLLSIRSLGDRCLAREKVEQGRVLLRSLGQESAILL